MAAVVLAAGRSTRMAPVNKLVADFGDAPVVRHAVDAATGAGLRPVIVVAGHQADRVASVLGGADVSLVHNPDFADGISTSVKAGVAAVPGDARGAVILLGDMPGITPDILAGMLTAFDDAGGEKIIQPRYDGQPGNPVLWPRRLFAEFKGLIGDVGAKPLLKKHAEDVLGVDVASPAIHMDIDNPEDLRP